MKTRSAVLRTLGASRPYVQSGPLEVLELDLEGPGPGELLVRVEAAGICHSDLSVVNGSRPRPVPMALGHEAAGTVEEVGSGVDDVTAGARVVLVFVPACGDCAECHYGRPAMCRRGAASNRRGELLRGGRRMTWRGEEVHHHLGVSAFSERIVVDRRSAVVVPGEVPAEVAALFGCAVLTGVGAVHNTVAVRPGDPVAVVGLGGVGLAAVMGAALAGAYPLIAIDPIAAKRDLAVELGATHSFAPGPDTIEAVLDLTGGGARFAVEAVGHEEVLADAFALTAPGGTTVAVGLPDPSRQLRIPAVQLVAEARTLVGSYMGSAVPQRDIPRLIGLWQAGRLPVERLHTGTVGLDELLGAFDALDQGRVVRQMVVP